MVKKLIGNILSGINRRINPLVRAKLKRKEIEEHPFYQREYNDAIAAGLPKERASKFAKGNYLKQIKGREKREKK